MNKLTVMDGSGDTEFTWNPDNPEEVETMRATVQTLKAQGFSFWLIDGRPADEVTGGNGTLVVRRRIDAEEVISISAPPLPEKIDRSRGPRAAYSRVASPAPPAAAGTEVVASRPLRGG